MSATDSTATAAHDAYALPLVIAVTGHRDLVSAELPDIRQRVTSLLQQLMENYPDRRLSVMSGLAEGADRLVAEVALDLRIDLTVPLPMAKERYLQDFETPDSRASFESLCNRAKDIFEMPLARGCTVDQISVPGPERDRQYAQLGVFLCAHCHVLLALWDGKPGGKLGGTGQVVKFHHDDIMPGYSPKTVATQQMLVDDESDLVYHIVCSRDRPNGEPYQAFKALECAWYTKDRHKPRSRELPKQHGIIFQRSGEFSRDAIRFSDHIEFEKYSLLDDKKKDYLPRGIEEINRIFGIADWLAIHYQKRTFLTLRVTHVLAFLMGLMFILYSDLEAQPFLMFLFLLFFLVAAAVQFVAKRDGWHRRYLDYRALAEGLRVQFYWAAAGVRNESESKFAHDNFLQTQDPELGWIRNVMRVSGTHCDAAPLRSAEGLEFSLNEWVGDDNSGQLSYYRTKALERIKKNRSTERLGLISLMLSVAIVVSFVVVGSVIPKGFVDPMMALMGTMLLLFAVRRGYAYSTAEKELIKQYEFMLRIFSNARRRLDTADDEVEQRQVLLALGGSALDEHAEWILMHRDRSIDQGEIWRMGS
ncbi:MAG: hypothetical protein OER97_07170 [Gammaproteobacteria bacterium]|nr:hypothetical protein [Gammaproteobacteria bacterium]